jgi:hypothetical protein
MSKRVSTGYPRLSRVVFVPNQELLEDQDALALRTDDRIVAVLCKSRYAASIFERFKSQHRCTWRIVGFVFPPVVHRPLHGVAKDRGLVFHPAGRSHMKSTSNVLDAWSRHPEWPPLFVTCDALCLNAHNTSLLQARTRPNIFVYTFLETEDFARLQSHAGYVVLPSACEGFGHSIYEAWANGSLLVGSDVPPMNETAKHMHNAVLAQPTAVRYIGTDDSFPWAKGKSQEFGDAGSACYEVSPASIETAIATALGLGDQEYTRIRQNAVDDWSTMVSQGLVSTRNALSQAGFPVVEHARAGVTSYTTG